MSGCWQVDVQSIMDGAQGRKLTDDEWAQVLSLLPCEAKEGIGEEIDTLTALNSEVQGCSLQVAQRGREYAPCPPG
jgi:hypothetical protein